MSFHTEREPTWGLKQTTQLQYPTLALQILFLLKLQLCGSSFPPLHKSPSIALFSIPLTSGAS